MAKVQESAKGFLRNRLDHQVIISYGDDTIALSPRGQSNILAKEKLGSLPAGVVFVQQ